MTSTPFEATAAAEADAERARLKCAWPEAFRDGVRAAFVFLHHLHYHRRVFLVLRS